LNVKVKGQRSRSPGTKMHCALITHRRVERKGTPSLQITSRKQQARRFDRCRGVSSPGCVRWAWRATAGLCRAFLVQFCSVFRMAVMSAGISVVSVQPRALPGRSGNESSISGMSACDSLHIRRLWVSLRVRSVCKI